MENDELELKWKPALSNSRLGVQTTTTPLPKINFDRMTIIGDLPTDRVEDMAKFLGNDPYVDLWEKMNNRFKGKALNEKVYIEHDRLKA
ncbi:replication initiation protein, partial [Staphylococcus aureus]